LREYVDTSGTTWRVWSVLPGLHAESRYLHLPEDLQRGWLCFECESEKRRLYPVPVNWESRSDTELDVMRRAAVPVNAPVGAGK
jgi:hypothetical protein